MSLYLDSSALLKRYIDEHDSSRYNSILDSDAMWLTCRITWVEVWRNLAADYQEGTPRSPGMPSEPTGSASPSSRWMRSLPRTLAGWLTSPAAAASTRCIWPPSNGSAPRASPSSQQICARPRPPERWAGPCSVPDRCRRLSRPSMLSQASLGPGTQPESLAQSSARRIVAQKKSPLALV